jgi:hypothetical protein
MDVAQVGPREEVHTGRCVADYDRVALVEQPLDDTLDEALIREAAAARDGGVHLAVLILNPDLAAAQMQQ